MAKVLNIKEVSELVKQLKMIGTDNEESYLVKNTRLDGLLRWKEI